MKKSDICFLYPTIIYMYHKQNVLQTSAFRDAPNREIITANKESKYGAIAVNSLLPIEGSSDIAKASYNANSSFTYKDKTLTINFNKELYLTKDKIEILEKLIPFQILIKERERYRRI